MSQFYDPTTNSYQASCSSINNIPLVNGVPVIGSFPIIDDYQTKVGDTVLLKNQLDQTTNGLYLIDQKWTLLSLTPLDKAVFVSVKNGTYGNSTLWISDNTHTIWYQYLSLNLYYDSSTDFYKATCASTVEISVLNGYQIVDGYQIKSGDSILVKDQTNIFANGFYIVQSDGTWQLQIFQTLNPVYVQVLNGLTNVNTYWVSDRAHHMWFIYNSSCSPYCNTVCDCQKNTLASDISFSIFLIIFIFTLLYLIYIIIVKEKILKKIDVIEKLANQ